MIFTEEFIAKIKKPSKSFERKYINFLSTEPDLLHLRKKIDQILTKYPEDKRTKLIKDIKNENDSICFSALSELFVFEVLCNNFEKVEVQIPLPNLNNLTPDFWVDDSLAIEVATIFNIVDPFENEIYEAFNQVRTNFKTIIYEINNASHNQPKLSEIKNEFIKLLNINSELQIGNIIDYKIITKNNISIIGKLFKSKDKNNTVAGTSMKFDFSEVQTILYQKRISGRIREKLLKYGKLTHQGIPLIVVIYDKTDLYFDTFWNDLLSNGPKRIFNPRFNTSLTALLIKDYDTGYDYKLAKNPYARVKLGGLEDKIQKAFGTRELK